MAAIAASIRSQLPVWKVRGLSFTTKFCLIVLLLWFTFEAVPDSVPDSLVSLESFFVAGLSLEIKGVPSA